MKRLPAVTLADLARALHQLKPHSAEASEAIARLLGFSIRPARRKAKRIKVREEAEIAPKSQEAPPMPHPGLHPPAPDEIIEFNFRHRSKEESKPTSEFVLTPVKPLEQGPSEEVLALPALQPLFRANWTRSIVSGSAATLSREGPIQWLKVCDKAARMELIKAFPRRPLPTLRRGVVVLVDVGQGMAPFRRDQEQLLDWIRRVVGTDRAAVFHFTGSPLRRVRSADFKWGPFTPARDVPVLLLTDLGIQRTLMGEWATESEWMRFVKLLRPFGSSVVAFVPYAASRWPRKIARAIDIIHWDHRTTILDVRRAVGHGHE